MSGYALSALGNSFRTVSGSEDCVNGETFSVTVPTITLTAADLLVIQSQQDAMDAKQYAKLQALSTMTPAQVQTWVQNNVNTLADAKDALKTLAVAVGILARRL